MTLGTLLFCHHKIYDKKFSHSWGPVAVHNFLAFRDQAAKALRVFYLMPQTTEVSKIMYPRHPRNG